MNLELLETFGQNYPEEFDGTLDSVSVAITCTFNRRGTLLAVGCNDGRIVVWDFLTRGIAKLISAHVNPVCSLSFNRSGYKLLSASIDNVVSIWDVLTGDCLHIYRFPSPVLKVQFHPRDDQMFLVCPMKHAAVIINVAVKEPTIIPLDEESQTDQKCVVASYDRRGDHIFTGNERGRIMVFKNAGVQLIASFRLSQSVTAAVKSIEFARRGSCLLINSADRIIRVYEEGEILACGKNGEPEPIQKLQDLVNKTLWKKCCFSGDGEYIVAGSAKQHSLYVWEKAVGNLVKILPGPKGELLLDVVWHPIRPIVCSVSGGVVSIWAHNQVENWSAFAPDFKELDENLEYEEKEGEFDLEDEDASVQENVGEAEVEDLDVDIMSCDKIAAFVSSDEEDEDTNCLLYLPIAPEVEDPEDCTLGLMDPLTSPEKRPPSPVTDTPAPKKGKAMAVELPGAPEDEVHPLLASKRAASQDKSRSAARSKPKSKAR
ncbi:retinoblastoma-binding protein 5-like [Watersipora subatra]|uniref:retinoblastoma-binding protein 5-like n=1 Tax=Watersipora subatra TaxID=2589382 RepID=UPI00355C24EC